jgi:hypothetical protein
MESKETWPGYEVVRDCNGGGRAGGRELKCHRAAKVAFAPTLHGDEYRPNSAIETVFLRAGGPRLHTPQIFFRLGQIYEACSGTFFDQKS